MSTLVCNHLARRIKSNLYATSHTLLEKLALIITRSKHPAECGTIMLRLIESNNFCDCFSSMKVSGICIGVR
jgi:hypothetical protein